LRKFHEKSLEKSLEIISCFWVKKFGKSLETGVSEHSEFTEILEIVLFRTFQKLRKNDVKLELRKSQKTCSDLKTDSKVRLKVWNAVP
jgi:hypothetical protein